MPDEGLLPIEVARSIAEQHDQRQVIVIAWDGQKTHVVTYGQSIEDSDQAAQGGELIKRTMGWPSWRAFPSRVERLVKLLDGSAHALRSYEFGNGAPDLARDQADAIEAALEEIHDGARRDV